MKKNIFIFMLFLFLITNIQVSASTKFSCGQIIPNMHITVLRNNHTVKTFPLTIIRDDGDYVYSIDPFIYFNTTNYYEEYNYNDKIFNITENQLKRINLIAHYGYNYKTHTELKWYGITQFLIWETLGCDECYFTDVITKEKTDEYNEEITEIKTLVEDYYVLPSIANKYYEYSINSNYELEDINQKLNSYEIEESNIDAKIINNKLIVNTKESGLYKIKFIKKSPINKDYKLYYSQGSMPLIYPGEVEDITFELTLEVNSGSITINKRDVENKKILEEAIYGLYDAEELITTININEEGIYKIDNLPFGKYYIKEISSSTGYKLDGRIYEANITKENKNVIIDSYSELIKGNLIINNYYDKNKEYVKEETSFEIYNINDKLIGEYSTKKGKINIKLPYGEYYLKQVKGIDGYKFIDKFNFSIKEEKEYVYDFYNEKELIVVEVPDTLKHNYNKYISLGLIVIGSIIIVIGKIRKRILKNY